MQRRVAGSLQEVKDGSKGGDFLFTLAPSPPKPSFRERAETREEEKRQANITFVNNEKNCRHGQLRPLGFTKAHSWNTVRSQ